MKIIITICSIVISALALAIDNIQPSSLTCSFNGSSVLYVNGVKTERWEAKEVIDHIKQSVTSSLLDKNNSNMETVYDLSYNKTMGWGPDFLESAVQKLNYLGLPSETSYVFLYHLFTYPGKMSEALLTKILNSATIARILIPLLPTLFSEADMKEIFADQYQQQISDSKELKKKISYSLLNNKKLILISHSQGNLFSVLAVKDFINGEELSYTGSDNTNVTGSYNDYGENITHVLISPPLKPNLQKNKIVLNNEDVIKFSGNLITSTFPENFIDPTDSLDLRVDGDRYLDHSVLQTYLNIHNITSTATDYTSLPDLREFTLQSIVDAAGLLESNCPIAKFDYSKSDLQIIFEIPDLINRTLKDLIYRWDFGDGTSKETTDKITEHMYQQSGNYPVKLTVTNRNYSDFGDEAVFEKIVEYKSSGPCTDELGYYWTNPDGSEGGYVSFSSSVSTSAYIHPSVSVCFYSNIEGNTVIDVLGDSAETSDIPLIYSSVIKDSTLILDRGVYEARLMVSNSTIENTTLGNTSNVWALFSTIKGSTFNVSYGMVFNYSEVFGSEINIIDSNGQKNGVIDILDSRIAFFQKTTSSQTIYIHSNNFRSYGEGNVLDEVFYIEPYNP